MRGAVFAPRAAAALALFAAALAPAAVHAEAIRREADTPAAEIRPPIAERRVDTRHSVAVDGRTITYTASAGTLTLRDGEGLAKASMFYVAYVADRPKGAPERPVTFLYNGGPGSSSIWLHMASFAPVRVPVGIDAGPGTALRLAPNPATLLGQTDMVFLDAIGTGYSDVFDPEEGKSYWGHDPDSASFTQAIRRYLDINGRWQSPKYLFGESYGTTRSAITALMLHKAGVQLDGIILMSSILNFAQHAPGLDRMAINQVPTYAASAWYHGKVDRGVSLDAHVEKARRFASGPYTLALAKGHDLPDAERDAVAAQMAALTGLSVDYLVQSQLRVMPDRFRKELLRGEGRVLGELDTRFTGYESDDAASDTSTDPAGDAIKGPVISSFLTYVRKDLNYRTDQPYHVSSPKNLLGIWDWSHVPPRGEKQNAMADVALDLAEAMRRNPEMRVLALNGYYDLSTPFFATEYDLSHMLLPKALRGNLTEHSYASGHMIYLDPQSLQQVHNDVSAFLTRRSGG
ncbi:S10 family peptidase [Croceicoccus bisphenolivorans]|uniref:S10 family peptidase n=1 Tax=Croceicoccus bisphenolivorans TaxID=1783232 RepID=UPI000830C66C|nr:hypothetical protein [Croceicoccus bisphenolivorans]